MGIVKHQVSFGAGELSPWLDGRTDIEKYSGGCRLLENFIVLPQGSVQKRPGTEFMGKLPGGAEAARLVEFQVSTSEAAMLVLVDEGMQIFSQGKPVKDPGSAWMTVSGISGTRGSMAGTYKPMRMANGYPVYCLSGLFAPQSNDAVISYDLELGWIIEEITGSARTALWRATVPSTVPLPDKVSGTTNGWTMESGGTGLPVLTRGAALYPLKLAIPWADTQLERLRWKQINSVAYFVHPEHPPYKLTRYAEDSWVLRAVDYAKKPPLLPENIEKTHTLTVTPTVVNTTIPNWAVGEEYAAGKKVRYQVALGDVRTYICMRKHTSKAGKTPLTATYREFVSYNPRAPRPGQVIPEVTMPMWVETFLDDATVPGEDVILTATADTWLKEHEGGIYEISKKRRMNSYEVELKPTASPQYSKPIIIQGGYTFITTGNWNGTFSIERSTDRGKTWEDVRSWESDTDRNVSAEGEEEARVQMRIKWEKSSSASGDGTGTPKPIATLTASESMIRGLVKITEFTNPKSVKAEVVTPVEITTTPYWREGAWSGVQGYPRTVELHQGRVVMAASKLRPHTLWGSAVDDYENFYPGTNADEAFAHTIAIGERDPILWLVSERFLLVGTGCGEWIMHGEEEEKSITPEFGQAKRHSSYGAHDGGVPACFSDSVSLFVQRGGTRVREFSYRYDADRYEAANLNLLADHLFDQPVADIAVQRMPWQIVWFVSGGKLYGLTYERAQNVAAWHRHSTQGEVLGVGAIRATSEEDEIWFVVKRGVELFIERFRPGQMARPTDEGWWLDSAAAVPPPFDFSPVNHLEGFKVAGWYDGLSYPEVLLTDDQWPFTSGVQVSGLTIPLYGSAGSGNPNGRYVVAGLREGRPWFRHETLGESFRIERVVHTLDDSHRWVLYAAGDAFFRSTGDVVSPQLAVWQRLSLSDTGDPTVLLLGEVPVDIPPATITVSGKLSPDATGVLERKGDSNGKPKYANYGPDFIGEGDYTELYWNGAVWILYTQKGQYGEESGAWSSGSPTSSPRFAMNWQPLDGKGIPSTGPVLVAGLSYQAVLQPMTPEIGLGNGSSRSRELRIHRVVPSLRWSRGGKIGETPEGKLDPLDAGAGGIFTGEIEKEFEGSHGTQGNVCLVSDEPYPFAVRSLALKMNVYGE
ncbi:hypothetical protein OJ996_25555 [Luteolibacter sp. GHJ8]|uniref:Uncharacterized protein n=1 Tax=Luteolibacter rhizosphaerae TaxID=2989719 RepID=A0ABT3GBV5_9BACT|nr:hypothetical protein [Luteolibacter rhizosphaerae]MCW1916981.1 hypothetical protein [Luteolibacter rhizosphaerae]